MSLLQASLADIPLIRRLADLIWHDHYPEVISLDQINYMLETMYSEAKLQAQIQTPGFVYWLVLPAHAHDKAAAIGFIAVENIGEGAYFLHKFYLADRRKGMGSKAFEQLLEKIPDARSIQLYVNRRNFKSVNFYFKKGFTILKWVDQPFGQGYVMDDFLMELKR